MCGVPSLGTMEGIGQAGHGGSLTDLTIDLCVSSGVSDVVRACVANLL